MRIETLEKFSGSNQEGSFRGRQARPFEHSFGVGPFSSVKESNRGKPGDPDGNTDALICCYCEMLVCSSLNVTLSEIRSPTRNRADAALARQIAMYLAHTAFGMQMTVVGIHFNRDRTTVSHGCALVEDRRDERFFDAVICELEATIQNMTVEELNACRRYVPGSQEEQGGAQK
ncbi:MAG: hypothetical protein OXR62_14175 [Ahrensia sp.]|nr:hypothetical protein [Ahrensia sp.]